jgi:hypothetical protein
LPLSSDWANDELWWISGILEENKLPELQISSSLPIFRSSFLPWSFHSNHWMRDQK